MSRNQENQSSKTIGSFQMTKLVNWETVELRGTDRVAFLSGLVTNKVQGLPPGSSNATLFLTPKGRIINEALLCVLPSSLLLLTQPGRGQSICEILEHYHVIEDVSFQVNEELVPWVLWGSGLEAWHQEQRAFGPLPQEGEGLEHTYLQDETPLWSTRLPDLEGAPALLLWSHKAQIEALRAALEADGATLQPEAVWFASRQHSGWYALEAYQGLLVHEAGLHESHVNYKKGCFVGQEVVARTQHRGRANNRLYVISFALNEAIQAGQSLYDEEGKEVGQLRQPLPQTAAQETQQWVALIKVKQVESTQPLWLKHNGERLPITVVR